MFPVLFLIINNVAVIVGIYIFLQLIFEDLHVFLTMMFLKSLPLNISLTKPDVMAGAAGLEVLFLGHAVCCTH